MAQGNLPDGIPGIERVFADQRVAECPGRSNLERGGEVSDQPAFLVQAGTAATEGLHQVGSRFGIGAFRLEPEGAPGEAGIELHRGSFDEQMSQTLSYQLFG